jgi:hypothetical protein
MPGGRTRTRSTTVGRIAAPLGAGPFFGNGLEFDGRTVIAADLGGHAYLYQVVPEPSTFALLMFCSDYLAFPKNRSA